MFTGWPADADLSNYLGLGPADDVDNVAGANAAARAEAVAICGLDDEDGPADAGLWRAVLKLGAWHYGDRNQPNGLDSLNPLATPYNRRVALGILSRGRLPIA
jgi:hypothetical protein